MRIRGEERAQVSGAGAAELAAIDAAIDERRRRVQSETRRALILPGTSVFLLGAFLIWLKPHLGLGEMADVVRDIGIGLIVAALAVCGHELLRQVSKMDLEVENLKAASAAAQAATHQLQDFKRLQEDGAIRSVLADSFPLLGQSCNGLFEALRDLEHAARHDRSGQDAEFIRWYLSDKAGITRYLQQLAQFRSTRVDSELRTRDPRQIAGHLLGAELAKLREPPDEYRSVTNPLYYDMGLMDDYGLRMTAEALARGVHLRRIFNLAGMEADLEYARGRFAKAKQVIEKQLELARRFPASFHIRFIGTAPFASGELPIRASFPANDQSHVHLRDGERAYFGLFYCSGKQPRTTLVISADPHRMSVLVVRSVEQDSQDVRAFEVLWNRWATDRNPFAGRALDLSVLRAEPVE